MGGYLYILHCSRLLRLFILSERFSFLSIFHVQAWVGWFYFTTFTGRRGVLDMHWWTHTHTRAVCLVFYDGHICLVF